MAQLSPARHPAVAKKTGRVSILSDAVQQILCRCEREEETQQHSCQEALADRWVQDDRRHNKLFQAFQEATDKGTKVMLSVVNAIKNTADAFNMKQLAVPSQEQKQSLV